jgi:phage-related minor tail protein
MALKLGELSIVVSTKLDEAKKGLNEAKDKAAEAGDKIKDSLGKAGVAAGAALAAGLLGAMNVESAQSKLTAQIGDPTYAKDLGEIAGRMYANGMGESLSDNMEAVRKVTSSGMLDEDATNEQIESVTTKVQALASTFELDVGEASKAAGQMVKTGMAKDANEALDILTRGFQQTGDMNGDLVDTFNEYGTQFRKLGLDGTTAMGLLSQGAKGGARDLDVVADSLKEFSIRSIDGSDATKQAFKDLGLNANKMQDTFAKGGAGAEQGLQQVLDKLRAVKDPADQAAIATSLFGTQAEDMGKALFSLDPSKATSAMGDVAGAADKMTAAVGDNPQAKLEGFKRKFQQAFVEKVSEALPYVEKFVGWIDKHSDKIGPLAAALAGVAAVIWLINTATAAWTAAQAALNVVMALNPVGLVIIAVIALIAIIWLLWTKCDGFRDAVKAVGHAFVAAWDWMKDAAGKAKDWVVEKFNMLVDFVTSLPGKYLNAGKEMWSWIGDKIADAAGWVKDKFETLVGFVTSLPGRYLNAGKAMWSWIGDKAGDAVSAVRNKIDSLIGFITSMPGKISSAARGMFDGIQSAFRGAVNWIIGKWNNLSFSIGGGNVFGVNLPRVSLDTPNIPMLASGGTLTRGGDVIVGEVGPERLTLPAGATVTPLRGGALPSGDNGSGPMELLVKISGDGILEGVQRTVRVRGGSPETVLVGRPAF